MQTVTFKMQIPVLSVMALIAAVLHTACGDTSASQFIDQRIEPNPGNSRFSDRPITPALRHMIQASLTEIEAQTKQSYDQNVAKAYSTQEWSSENRRVLDQAAVPHHVSKSLTAVSHRTINDASQRANMCSKLGATTATSGKRHVYCRNATRHLNSRSLKTLASSAEFTCSPLQGDCRQVQTPQLSVRGKKVPMCAKWNVVTTLKPTVTTVQLTEQHDQGWCTVIVLDKNSADDTAFAYHDQPYIVVLTAEDQEALPYKMLKHMPWRHFGRKNIGYLLAVHHGAEVIYDTDDDNQLFPLSNAIPADRLWNLTRSNDSVRAGINIASPDSAMLVPRHVRTPVPVDGSLGHAATTCTDNKERCHEGLYHNGEYRPYHVANPYVFFGGRGKGWPRGYPLDRIRTDEAQDIQIDRMRAHADKLNVEEERVPVQEGASAPVGVVQTLAHADPDYDAIYRLTSKLPVMWRHARTTSLVYERGTFVPFNAQATLWHETAFWGLALPVTVHGRVSDIWRSYITQRVMWETGLHVAFNSPWVNQYRNAHDYLKDFDSEQPLYHSAGDLLSLLSAWRPSKEFGCTLEKGCSPETADSLQMTAKHALAELMVVMYEFGVLERTDLDAVFAFLGDLTRMGYQFPPLTGERHSRRLAAPADKTAKQKKFIRGKTSVQNGWTPGDTPAWAPVSSDPNRAPSKCNRLAVCMMGRLRSGMYTWRQNKEYYFDRLGCPYDVFLVMADDEAGPAAVVYRAAGVRASREPPQALLTNKNGKTKLSHSHVWENIVRQFHDWKSCADLVQEYSNATGVTYDWMARHRLDHTMLTNGKQHTVPIRDLPSNAISIPLVSYFRGINDRQAIGPMHLMQQYMRAYDFLEEYVADDSMIYTKEWRAIRPGKYPDSWLKPTAEGIMAFHFYQQSLPRSFDPPLLPQCKLFMHEEIPLVGRAGRTALAGFNKCNTHKWTEQELLASVFEDEVVSPGLSVIDGEGATYRP